MTLSGLSWEAQLALFAPYCGGREREPLLRQALVMLPSREYAGERTLVDAPAHRFFLHWDPVQAPLEPCRCVLRFESRPGVDYRFECPAHQLLSWFMEGPVQGRGNDLPDSFWQWLLLSRFADDRPL